MKELRYIEDVSTLTLDTGKCIGCGECTMVCPHSVFEIADKKAMISDINGCMECGACHQNCPAGAISVNPGVGCAAYIISGWIYGKENASCGGPDGGCC